MPRKIIIDTDPGIDDAMAIFFALKSPELDVVGLTTIFGNVHTDLATVNALRLLEIASRIDIPVAKGADHPLTVPFKGPVPFVHGHDGQGDVNLPPPTTEAIPESAANFIVEQIMTFPGEITLVPIGPLTNLALALRLDARIAENVREVGLMGGNAFTPGNVNPAAEANIINDPEAADLVFGAGWPVTMVGLDVTNQVKMSPDHLAVYQRTDNPMAQHIARIVPFYLNFHKVAYAFEGIHVHDSSTIAYLVDPGAFRTAQYPLRVETMGFSRGKTWPFTGLVHHEATVPWQNRPSVNVCIGVDAPRTIALELSRIAGD